MLNSYRLDSPKLDWSAEGAPISSEFDDVYFDKESGLEETRYVFLKHNRLVERWSSMTQRHLSLPKQALALDSISFVLGKALWSLLRKMLSCILFP